MADDEEEPKPAKRKRSKQVSKPVVVTLAVGLATAYFEYRTRTAKDTAEQAESKTDKGYETLAPLVRDLQEQVKVLAVQVDLLRQVALAKRGVFVSNGDFYAATVVERLGRAPDGLVRAGCSCYTSGDEVERLIEGVRDITG